MCAMHSALVCITLKVDRLAAMFEDYHSTFQICIVSYSIDVVLKCVNFNAGMLVRNSSKLSYSSYKRASDQADLFVKV